MHDFAWYVFVRVDVYEGGTLLLCVYFLGLLIFSPGRSLLLTYTHTHLYMTGLNHATIKCTGKKGAAVGSLWGLLKYVYVCMCMFTCLLLSLYLCAILTLYTHTHTYSTECDPGFWEATANFTLTPGCNVAIANTSVSAFLEGCPGAPKLRG